MLFLIALVLAVVSVMVLNSLIMFFGGLYLVYKKRKFERWLNERS